MIEAHRSSWTDVSDHLATVSSVAILPFGATEAHGPHLPLGTDTMVADEVARRIAEEFDAVLLPPVHYGDTWGTAGYPGTMSLSTETVAAIAVDLGRAASAAGARLFVIVNGDFGNRIPLALATRTLATIEGFTALTIDYPGMDDAIESVRVALPAAPGLNHAEEAETSIILALDPDAVHPDRYRSEYPEFPADFGLRPMQVHRFSASGVFGDPSHATADKGRAILDATVAESVRRLRPLVESLDRS
ncbi:creatininase family protein [Amnibacterium flavum]|uniref:Creatininase n=1 Tax=Amnibacterium flavum TaxID=2173173 RepID=A0A2V1HUP0_9MICO|nr:creatininase family protein [Amnibacterium flavum]PVZ94017.1 creatininase [Amnibacterium flavum]